jgi:hypothetical protein
LEQLDLTRDSSYRWSAAMFRANPRQILAFFSEPLTEVVRNVQGNLFAVPA